MKQFIQLGFAQIILLLMIGSFTACDSDQIPDESLYTFTDQLVGQYLDSDTTLSEFYKLVERSKVLGLLNSYGEYTCFAPTNNAFRAYYQSKGKTSIDQFTDDSLKLIVYDHLINGAIVNYVDFKVGRLFNMTMSDRYLSVEFTVDGKAYVNKNSLILQKDIIVHNGVIHTIDNVLDPIRSGVVEVISKEPEFSLFYTALVATGLADSLLLTIDENYNLPPDEAKLLEDAVNTTIASVRVAPRSRKYGYTLLMESNDTYAINGITDLESMKSYAAGVYDQLYPQDASISDITDRRNSLNRFIAYHLINKELSYSKFISDYNTPHMFQTVDLFEYIEPMCPNTLIEVKIQSSNADVNIFNYLPDQGKSVRLVNGNYDNDATNGVYHEIDKILEYSVDVEAMMSTKRLRFDVASFFSELTNNNMRGRPSDNLSTLYRNALPVGYLDRLIVNEQTVVCYSNAHDKLMNYMGDELFVVVPSGRLYDLVFITPPVPAGTYEIRFGYQSNGRRGVAQFYVDGVPSGVPVNLNSVGSHPSIGYELPGNNVDDIQGFENDKMMRNRGYMKGPNSFKAVVPDWYSGSSSRYNIGNLRKILGTYNFSEAGNHEIMVKGLSSGQFQIDFIKFVPTSLIENEDIN